MLQATTGTFTTYLTPLLNRRELRRRQEAARHLRVDDSVFLACSFGFLPIGVGQEGIPLLLSVGERFPRKHVGQIVGVGADEGRPGKGEAGKFMVNEEEGKIVITRSRLV